MSGHSKGPWKVEPHRSRKHTFTVWTRGGGLVVPMLDTSPANARLIAAAPDLLAALKGLLQQFVGGCDGCPLDANGSCDASPECMRYDLARAAIAKAEGEGTP